MRRNLQAAAGAIALVCAGAPAHAAERGDFVLGLGTETPGAAATLKFDVTYRDPDDPNAKPPPITGAVFRLPEGIRIDQDAATKCTASDEELRARGTAACPPDSRIGGGTLTAITGFGPPVDPVVGDVTVFNGDGQLIELVTVPGTGQTAGFDRLTIEGNTLEAHPPATPGGPPDGKTSIKEIHILVDRPGFAFAPPSCPGRWEYGASFEFGDGGTAEVARTLPCTRATGGTARPAITVASRPGRVRAGRRTTFRFTAASPSRRCRSGAKVAFAGQRARTDRHGRAAVRVTLERPGSHRVWVAKRGCGTGRGAVQAVRSGVRLTG